MRMKKVTETMKQEISRILAYDMNDPRIGFVTVTRVEVAADIRSARVYISVLGDEKARKGTLIETPGVEFVWRSSLCALAFRLSDLRRDCCDDRLSYFILDREDIVQFTVVALGPNMVARFRVD